jgi:hypothetical protein
MSRPEAELSNPSSVRFSKVLPRRLRRGHRQCDHSPQDAEALLCRSLRDEPTRPEGAPPGLRVPSHVRSPLLRIKHRSDLTSPRSEGVEHHGRAPDHRSKGLPGGSLGHCIVRSPRQRSRAWVAAIGRSRKGSRRPIRCVRHTRPEAAARQP